MPERIRVINRRKYQLAQEMITKGAWVPDVAAGTLYSAKFQRQLSPTPNASGYHTVAVWLPEKRQQLPALVSRILWEFQHGPIPDGYEVNHKNGNTCDNTVGNLEILTQGDNIRHAHETGLWPSIIRSDLASDIAAALAAGDSLRSAARRFGVGVGTVHRIRAQQPGYSYTPPDPNRTAKDCPGCEVNQPLANFHRAKGRCDGYAVYCKPCTNAKKRQSYLLEHRHRLEKPCPSATSSDGSSAPS